MNAIRVWAVPGCSDLNPLNSHIVAAIDNDVEHLAIQGMQSTDHYVL
jgi:hypothetical protein